MKTAGVPEIYRTADPAKCRVRDSLDEWATNTSQLLDDGKGALIFGPIGTGKSCTAALTVAAAVKAGRTARWAYVPDLCDRMLDGSRSRAELRNWHMDVDLLVLDDLGVRTLSDYEAGMLDQIVEARYRKHKSMIVTTNLTPDDLKASRQLARMRDRWRQCCRAWTIGGKSMRAYS